MTAADFIAANPRITGYTLALNYLPLAQLLAGVAFVVSQATSLTAAVLWSLAWIYLLPPLVCHAVLLVFGRPSGRGLTQETRAYKVWWFTYQWQIVFNRLPWLEEICGSRPASMRCGFSCGADAQVRWFTGRRARSRSTAR